jgi:outer membrane receptor protein involved in Fe transport
VRASNREGIEFSNTYRVCPWMTLNADYSWSHGRLIGIDPEVPGQHIPEAITTTFSGGPSIQLPSGLYADLRFRYFGPRALIEDNSFSSRATDLFDLTLGYRNPRYTVGVELLNLFNTKGHDIDYYYGTGLKTDPGFPFPPGANGINDDNFKRVEPFQARFFFTLRW